MGPFNKGEVANIGLIGTAFPFQPGRLRLSMADKSGMLSKICWESQRQVNLLLGADSSTNERNDGDTGLHGPALL